MFEVVSLESLSFLEVYLKDDFIGNDSLEIEVLILFVIILLDLMIRYGKIYLDYDFYMIIQYEERKDLSDSSIL